MACMKDNVKENSAKSWQLIDYQTTRWFGEWTSKENLGIIKRKQENDEKKLVWKKGGLTFKFGF